MKKYDNMTDFDKGTEKVWKSGKFWQGDWKSVINMTNFEKDIEKVWKSGNLWQGDWKSIKSGQFWEGDWKSMIIWPILRRKLKKYENLV